jgi:hypothetical protein
VVLVKKKDGTVRFCTDYRCLNALTKDEAAPLPRIQVVLRDFGNAQVFSSLDLKSGYWQKILLWVPEAARKRVLHEFHDVPEAGHPGYEETLRSILG